MLIRNRLTIKQIPCELQDNILGMILKKILIQIHNKIWLVYFDVFWLWNLAV